MAEWLTLTLHLFLFFLKRRRPYLLSVATSTLVPVQVPAVIHRLRA